VIDILLEFKELPFMAIFVYVVILFLKHIQRKDDKQTTAVNNLSESVKENTIVLKELKNELKSRSNY